MLTAYIYQRANEVWDKIKRLKAANANLTCDKANNKREQIIIF